MIERIVLPAAVETPWARNNRVPALLGLSQPAAGAGVVILHGYTMAKEAMEDQVRTLASWGIAALAPDLPLHGERTIGPDGYFDYPFFGDPAGVLKAFENALADITACAHYLRDRLGPDVPLAITGYSLGGCLTILTQARRPGLFRAGVSVVGAARLARLLFASSICSDIAADLAEHGYDERSLEPILRPVEATAYASQVRDLLLIGAHDDPIVPGRLVQETYGYLDPTSNDCVMLDGCGHFPSDAQIARHAFPFLMARLGGIG